MNKTVTEIGSLYDVEYIDEKGIARHYPAVCIRKLTSFDTLYAVKASAAIYGLFLDAIPENSQIQFEKEFKELIIKFIDEGHSVFLNKEGNEK